MKIDATKYPLTAQRLADGRTFLLWTSPTACEIIRAKDIAVLTRIEDTKNVSILNYRLQLTEDYHKYYG